jgi:hypothetical protein
MAAGATLQIAITATERAACLRRRPPVLKNIRSQ